MPLPELRVKLSKWGVSVAWNANQKFRFRSTGGSE
jgi:hypothetical protein